MPIMQSTPSIINPRALDALLRSEPDDVLVVDLCQQSEGCELQCVQGAVHLDPSDLVFGDKPITGLLPPKDALQALFRRIGLQPDTHVIVYDDAQSTWAARMVWTLDIVGHEKVTLLDGGLACWIKEGLPLDSAYAEPARSDINIYPELSMIADKDYILNAMNHNQLTVWDARSEDEYMGVKAFSKRAGHIPGAMHYEWKRLLGENGQIRDLSLIREELLAIGLSPDKEVITHCQTHRRSSLTYFVAKKLLDYDKIKAYPGSWSEWGNIDETPVAS